MFSKASAFIYAFIALNSIIKCINCFQVNGIEFDKNQVHKTEVFERYVQAVKDENQAIGLQKLKDSIEVRSNELELNFENKLKKFFWDMEKLVNDLINNKNDSNDGYVIKKISNLITTIVYKEYALHKKANEISKEILNQQDSYWLESSAKALDKRVQLRAYISGFQEVDSIWKILHLLFKQHISSNSRKELKQLYMDCNKERENYGELAYKTSLKVDREYAKYSRQVDKNKFENSKDFLARIDKLIDEKSGCKEVCSNLSEGTWETFYTKPLYAKNMDIINNLIEQYVSKDLIDGIAASDNSIRSFVADISLEDANQVQEDDMEEFYEKFLKAEGLLSEIDIDESYL